MDFIKTIFRSIAWNIGRIIVWVILGSIFAYIIKILKGSI